MGPEQETGGPEELLQDEEIENNSDDNTAEKTEIPEKEKKVEEMPEIIDLSDDEGNMAELAAELNETLTSIKKNEEEKKMVEVKIKKYNKILKSITGDLS